MITKSPYTIPILGKNQSNLTYNITVNKSGPYVIVVNYLTPIDDPNSYTIRVEGVTQNASLRGVLEFYNCHYTSLCRQIITNNYGGVEVYNIIDNNISIKLFVR